MNNITAWYLGLSRVGKAFVIGSASVGGLMTTSALTTPPTNPTEKPIPAIEVTEKKEKEKPEPVVTTEAQIEKQKIPFNSVTREDPNLPSGQTRIESNGTEGEKTITHTITFTDNIETNRQTSEEVTLQPTDRVTVVGTYVAPAPQCDGNYSGGCVPVVSYDLDCPDIGFSVAVVGVDVHRFDRDRDGYGCESY